MPRDPTGVRPQGALSRHPADWFSDNLYTASYSSVALLAPGTVGYWAVGLSNNDQNGSVCKIYGFSAAQYSGGGMAVNFVNGTTGLFNSTALPIRPDYPVPNVNLYVQSQSSGGSPPYPFSFGNLYGVLSVSGFDSDVKLSPFPLFIIPVGWSLVMSNLVSTDYFACSFWFQLTTR